MEDASSPAAESGAEERRGRVFRGGTAPPMETEKAVHGGEMYKSPRIPHSAWRPPIIPE